MSPLALAASAACARITLCLCGSAWALLYCCMRSSKSSAEARCCSDRPASSSSAEYSSHDSIGTRCFSFPNSSLQNPINIPLVDSSAQTFLVHGAVHHDFIAEQTNLGVALDIDGFVFAQFGFGGDEQGSVIYVGRGGVAGEEDEIAPKAFGVGQ